MSCINFPKDNTYIVLNRSLKRICNMDQNHTLLLQCFINMAGNAAIGFSEYVIRKVTFPLVDIFSQESFSKNTYRDSLAYLEYKGYIKRELRNGMASRITLKIEVIQNAIDTLPDSPHPTLPDLDGYDESDYPTKIGIPTLPDLVHLPYQNWYGNPTKIDHIIEEEYKCNKRQDKAEPHLSPNGDFDFLNAYALTSYGGSVGDRLRDDCQPANLNIVCSSASETALELKSTVCPVSDGNVEILLPIPGHTEINKPMTSHEVVQSMLAEYAKLPNSIKDHRQKGSAVSLFRKFGDLLLKTVGNDGESAIAAFSSFLADDFWKSQGWPFFAFVSQYNEFLVKGSGEGAENQTESVAPRKNSKFAISNKRSAPGIPSKFPVRNYDEPAQRYIPAYVPDVNAKARHKRDEALTLLQSANTSMFNTCMDDIYGPITDEIKGKIDAWHDQAVFEFRDKLKREPIVKCKYKVSE